MVSSSSPPAPSSTGAPSPPPSATTPTTGGNAIDTVVSRLEASHGLWVNGAFPKLDSPPGAKTDEVLQAMFARTSFDKGRVKTFKIVEERDVTLGGDPKAYHAARLETDQGNMVVLMRFESNTWWTRAFQQ